MKKKIQINPHGRQVIINLLNDIKKQDVYENGFSSGKNTIKQIFASTRGNEFGDVLARLTLVDSMYSTQMGRRYYGLDELAEAICIINKQQSTKVLFEELTRDKNLISHFVYVKKENNKEIKTNLFSEKYGIGKDATDKGIAISLISKYAYFETGYKFPIYDSIACEMYPLIWEYCGFEKKQCPKLLIREKGKQDVDALGTIVAYISAINLLIEKLGGNISYDHLDRLLWFVGKIRRGNLSLVLSRKQYEECIGYLESKKLYDEKRIFNIDKINSISDLKFINPNSLLFRFFELAKYFGSK